MNVNATDSAGGAVAEELNEHATTALANVFSLCGATFRSVDRGEGLREGELGVADRDGCWGGHGSLLFVDGPNIQCKLIQNAAKC